MELRKNENETSGMSFQQKYKSPSVADIATNAIRGDRDIFLQPDIAPSPNVPIYQTGILGVLAKLMPKNRTARKVKENCFTEQHGQAPKDNGEDRKTNSKNSKNIDKEYSLPKNLPGIDLAQGLARVDGNTMLYTKVLQMFVTDYTSIGHQIETALNNNELESVEKLVHTVKGVAGTIGAQSLAKAALALEKSTNKEKQIYKELAQFIKVLQLTISSLTTLPCIASTVTGNNKRKASTWRR